VRTPKPEVCSNDVNAVTSALLILLFLLAGMVQEALRDLWAIPEALVEAFVWISSRLRRPLLLIFMTILASAAWCQDRTQTNLIGKEVAIPRHLQDGEEYELSIPKLIQFGESLFNGLRAYDNQRLLPSGPESPHEDPKELIECCQSWSGMSALQCRELLAKGEVFQKQPTTIAEEAPDRSRQEPNGVYHVPVLSHSACGWQRRMLLKSQADRILARHRDISAGLRASKRFLRS